MLMLGSVSRMASGVRLVVIISIVHQSAIFCPPGLPLIDGFQQLDHIVHWCGFLHSLFA